MNNVNPSNAATNAKSTDMKHPNAETKSKLAEIVQRKDTPTENVKHRLLNAQTAVEVISQTTKGA